MTHLDVICGLCVCVAVCNGAVVMTVRFLESQADAVSILVWVCPKALPLPRPV